MLHLPARFWALPSGSHLTEQDWVWCEQLAKAGVHSALGFSFYRLDDWHRLLDLGYRDVQLRLWHSWGLLEDVSGFCSRYEAYISDLAALCVRYGARLSVCPLNEPNLELAAMPEAVRDWLAAWRAWMHETFPEVELTTPALSRSVPNAYLWLEVLRDEYVLWDSIGVHFYWQTSGDLIAGADWSPEWMMVRFPSKPIRVTECGGADGTSRDWRYETYQQMLARYGENPDVASAALYLMSSEDPRWQEHWYDDRIVGILAEAAAWWPEKALPEIGERMDAETQAKIDQLLAQNAILCEMWKLFRQGKFTGADGIDGKIVELQGGQPLAFEPSYPPK